MTMSKLTTRDVTDLDTLRHMNLLLREVRAREAGMEGEMEPVRGVDFVCVCSGYRFDIVVWGGAPTPSPYRD